MAALYFDLGSPYAYLAVARARSVFGGVEAGGTGAGSGMVAVGGTLELRPVLLGAMFRLRGWGSWSEGPDRATNVADIEARAARYGLPPLAWPDGWPLNTLAAMRAAVWAQQTGHLEAFALAAYAREFADGADISDLDVLAGCAVDAGLDPAAMRIAIVDPAIKEHLKRLTQAAWDAGVHGVPSVQVGDTVLYGDDHLEAAAALAR
jgi:2-hydroxychromene-2-carboxylate isomerase